MQDAMSPSAISTTPRGSDGEPIRALWAMYDAPSVPSTGIVEGWRWMHSDHEIVSAIVAFVHGGNPLGNSHLFLKWLTTSTIQMRIKEAEYVEQFGPKPTANAAWNKRVGG